MGSTLDLRGEMHAQEQRFGARFDAEKHEGTQDTENTDKKLAEITEQLQKLETRPTPTPSGTRGSWTARFVILGG